jgi:hypothetical protein
MYQVTLLDKTSKEQVTQFLNLLNQSFDKSLSYYHWKHDLEEIYEIEEYTFCIFKDGLCIATLQVIINTMLCANEENRFAILSDGATQNDYRRLGLFEMLLSHTNEFCKFKNVSFIYGTGNSKSRKAFYKLRFEDFFTTLKATKKVRYNHPVMKIYNIFLNTFGTIRSTKFKNIKEVSLKDYSMFSANQTHNHSVSFKKTEDYLKWRLSEPTGDYKIYGSFDGGKRIQAIIVIKKTKDLLYIVDAICNDDTNYLNKLIQFVSSLAIKDRDVTKINCSHSNFKNLKAILYNNSFKITKAGSSVLLFTVHESFNVSENQLNNMHYMRIDKNE